ncbi:MAG: MBL fold metallo-hydrolase [Jiangellaceae bacterium]
MTHEHPDHMVDLHGLLRARWFGGRGAAPLPLSAPAVVVGRVAVLEDADDVTVRRVFDWHPLPAAACEIGPFRLDSWALPHFVPNAGIRLTAPGLTVAYTGDTGQTGRSSTLRGTPICSSPRPATGTSTRASRRLRRALDSTSRLTTPARRRRKPRPGVFC